MNFTKTLLSLIVIFLGIVFVSGCSLNDKLNDMHDKTGEMAETTKTMANTSESIKGTAEDTYYGLRKPTSWKARSDALDCILENADMGTKLSCATAYYYGFEFQNWKDEGPDNLEELDILKDQAIEEYFEKLQKFYHPTFFSEIEKAYIPLNSQLLNFYALAATMHKILGEQIVYGAHKGFTPPSIYSIIADGLLELKNNPTRDPDTMPRWMFYVQKFQPFALDLLKARVLYIPVQLYAEATGLNKLDPYSAWNASRSDQKSWNIDLYSLPLAAINSFNDYMAHALQTRLLLKQLGEVSGLDDSPVNSLNIKSIFNNMQIVESRNTSDPALAQKKLEVAKFKYFVDLLKMPLSNFSKVEPSKYLPTSL